MRKKFDLRKIKRINLNLLKRLPPEEKRITIPTVFTLIRILLTPFIVISMIAGNWGFAFGLFLTACITDTIDGSLARYLNAKTFLGACLDPIGDKLLILSIFFTLAFVKTPLFVIPLWFVLLVLCKELILVFGALFLFIRKGNLEVRPTMLGKLTTVAQMSFIMWLFACYFFRWMPVKTYYTMLSILLLLIGLSLIQYMRIGLQQQSAQ
jgi:cardiolipin synthase (CMP-forming)